METDKKVRIAENYYRKNTLKKYFRTWTQYTSRSQYLTNKLIPKRRNISGDPKPGVGVEFDSKKNDSANERDKKVIPENKESISYDFDLAEPVGDAFENKSQRFRYNIILSRVFKLWKNYSLILLNRKFNRLRIENVNNERLRETRKSIIIIHRALLLLKTTWKMWYQNANKSSIG